MEPAESAKAASLRHVSDDQPGTEEFGDTEAAAKAAMVSAVQLVAKEVGNTPAVGRKCYIHPAILDAFQNHEHFDRWRKATDSGGSTSGLTDEENALLRFLDAPST